MFEGMKIVEIVVQGGSVGIAGLLIFVVYKLMTNHIEHSDRVIDKNTEALNVSSAIHAEHTLLLKQLIRLLEQRL